MTTLPLTPDELLTTTRSVRKRLDLTRDVPLELVRECIEIALQAPSGSNRQGWHWVVVTDPDLRHAVGDVYRRAVDDYVAAPGYAGAPLPGRPRARGRAAARRRQRGVPRASTWATRRCSSSRA